MTQAPPHGDQDDEDRVVSRRVEHPTTAAPGDEAAYRAADPLPDDPAAATGRPGGSPGASSTEAAAELAQEDESEPRRSE